MPAAAEYSRKCELSDSMHTIRSWSHSLMRMLSLLCILIVVSRSWCRMWLQRRPKGGTATSTAYGGKLPQGS